MDTDPALSNAVVREPGLWLCQRASTCRWSSCVLSGPLATSAPTPEEKAPRDAWLSHISQRQVRFLMSICENRPAGSPARRPAEPHGPELQASAVCGALGGARGLRRRAWPPARRVLRNRGAGQGKRAPPPWAGLCPHLEHRSLATRRKCRTARSPGTRDLRVRPGRKAHVLARGTPRPGESS